VAFFFVVSVLFSSFRFFFVFFFRFSCSVSFLFLYIFFFDFFLISFFFFFFFFLFLFLFLYYLLVGGARSEKLDRLVSCGEFLGSLTVSTHWYIAAERGDLEGANF